jgi:hypothetical protein
MFQFLNSYSEVVSMATHTGSVISSLHRVKEYGDLCVFPEGRNNCSATEAKQTQAVLGITHNACSPAA